MPGTPSKATHTAPMPFTPSPSKSDSSGTTSPALCTPPTPAPLLATSFFAQFDYFTPGTPTSPTIDFLGCQGDLSVSPSISPSGNHTQTHNSSQPRLGCPGSLDVFDIHPNLSCVELNSPETIESSTLRPYAGRRREKRSEAIGHKGNVNWARPIFISDDATSESRRPTCLCQSQPRRELTTGPIFGTSAQRSRRLNKTSTIVPLTTPSPSASSSEDEPTTPKTPVSLSALAPPKWTLPRVSDGTGLGLGPEGQWTDGIMSPSAGRLDESKAQPTSSSGSSVRSSRASSERRALSASDSLVELSTPTTLAELRDLRQAALELEEQCSAAKGRPGTSELTINSIGYATPPGVLERRIKRKAVPVLEPLSAEPTLSSPPAITPSPPVMHTSTYILASDPPLIPCSSPHPVLCSRTKATQQESQQAPTLPLRKSFYANVRATMSALEISPRSSSLPCFPPPPPRARRPSTNSSIDVSDDESFSACEWPDLDPPRRSTAGDERKSRLATHLGSKLRALNASTANVSSQPGDRVSRGNSKKSFTRFFQRRSAEA